MNNHPHIEEESDDAERTEGVLHPTTATSDSGETFAEVGTTTPLPTFTSSFSNEIGKILEKQSGRPLHPEAMKQLKRAEAATTEVGSLFQKLKEATTGVGSKEERREIVSRVVKSYFDSCETLSPTVESIQIKVKVLSPTVESIKTKCEAPSPAVESTSQKENVYFTAVESSLRTILTLSTTVESSSHNEEVSSTAVEGSSINNYSHSPAVESSSQTDCMLSPVVEDTSQNKTTLSPTVESTSPKKIRHTISIRTAGLLDQIDSARNAKAIRFEDSSVTSRIKIKYPEQGIPFEIRSKRTKPKQAKLLGSLLHFVVGCVSTLHALSALLDTIIVATSGSTADYNANSSRRSTLRSADYLATWTTHRAPVYYQSHTMTQTHKHAQACAVAFKTRTAYAAVFLHSFYHSVAISPTAGRAPPPHNRWIALSIDMPLAASRPLAA